MSTLNDFERLSENYQCSRGESTGEAASKSPRSSTTLSDSQSYELVTALLSAQQRAHDSLQSSQSHLSSVQMMLSARLSSCEAKLAALEAQSVRTLDTLPGRVQTLQESSKPSSIRHALPLIGYLAAAYPESTAAFNCKIYLGRLKDSLWLEIPDGWLPKPTALNWNSAWRLISETISRHGLTSPIPTGTRT